MTRDERMIFISEFIDSVRKDVFKAAKHMPERWDEIELRQYIADRFKASTYQIDRLRMRAYTKEMRENPHI